MSAHIESPAERRRLDRLAEKCRANLRRGKAPASGLTAAQARALRERYSTFVDVRSGPFIVGGAHLIHNPATPRPCVHLMTSIHPRNTNVFGSFADQYGGGFCCVDSVLAGTITSHGDRNYVPTSPRPEDFRTIVIREERRDGELRDASGRRFTCWHLVPQANAEPERYCGYFCHQGIGFVLTTATRNRLLAGVALLVPIDDALEMWGLSLANLENRRRRISVFAAVKWGIDSYPGYYFDPRVVCSGEVYPELNALAAVNNDQNNKSPRAGFIMADRAFKSFDLSGEAFWGGNPRQTIPFAAMQGRCSNSAGLQPYMGLVGAMHFEITIAPKGNAALHLLVGKTECGSARRVRDLRRIRRRYIRPDAMAGEFSRLHKAWAARIAAELAATGDAEFDRFFNVWSKVQASSTARFTRALDKVGVRDVMQDLMSVTPFDAEYVRTEFLNALQYQYPDGRAVRQYERFKGGGHDERMYMDNALWMTDTLVRYLCDTGDFDLLGVRVPFLRSTEQATVYEHALRTIRGCFRNRGQKGLCLTGHGDWNDALDGIGRGGKGVSVWLSVALVYFSCEMLRLADHLGDRKTARELEHVIRTMTRTVNRSAWDGQHYIYGFNDKGEPIGSNRNLEGKVHLNVNTWAIMSGVAQAGGRVEAVLRSLERLDTPVGHLLLAPPYTAKSRKVGRIADMLPGMFENAAVYTHGQSFFAAAMVSLRRGSDAFHALKATMPDATIPDISTAPLHQQTNFAAGKAHPNFGQHLYTNFTGSLAWYRRTIEWMLGVIPDFDALVIDPCIPRWPSYEVQRRWRGGLFHVTVHNPRRLETGVKAVTMDGRPLGGNRIAPMTGAHKVHVLMG